MLSKRAQSIRAERGGVFAVVSERGMGKTTALCRLQELVGDDPIGAELVDIDAGEAPLSALLGRLRARRACRRGPRWSGWQRASTLRAARQRSWWTTRSA